MKIPEIINLDGKDLTVLDRQKLITDYITERHKSFRTIFKQYCNGPSKWEDCLSYIYLKVTESIMVKGHVDRPVKYIVIDFMWADYSVRTNRITKELLR